MFPELEDFETIIETHKSKLNIQIEEQLNYFNEMIEILKENNSKIISIDCNYIFEMSLKILDYETN